MKKNIPWLIGIGLLLIVCICFLLFQKAGKGQIACIYADGELIREIDLSAVTESYTFSVETPYGVNEIQVEPGDLRVISGDCPDHVCVRSGSLRKSGLPIVCLPHRLVIQLENASGGLDSVTR